MRHLSFRTESANEKIVKRDWYVVDATNKTLGRMSSVIASTLRGKNKTYYTPHFDCGDYVIVINSGKVVLTGNKLDDKQYINYSGYPGGKKEEVAKGSMLNNVDLSPEKNYCHVTVEDDGIGFEPEYKERIFGMFQKLHGKDEYAGTGIGLAIVRKIVENHNGFITATSELNKGARFDIYIPDN